MSNSNENVKKIQVSAEELQMTLARLRNKMIILQDDFDVTSLAIRCIERDLQEMEANNDEEATNAANA